MHRSQYRASVPFEQFKAFQPEEISLLSPLFDHKKLSEIAFEIQMNFGFKTLTTVRFAVALWTAHAVNPLESFPATCHPTILSRSLSW